MQSDIIANQKDSQFSISSTVIMSIKGAVVAGCSMLTTSLLLEDSLKKAIIPINILCAKILATMTLTHPALEMMGKTRKMKSQLKD